MARRYYPLLFRPVYRDYIWGGRRIPEIFGREPQAGVCAESWEISDRPEGMSIVRNGPLAGATLQDLVAADAQGVTGRGAREAVFPLLIKIIDAAQRLSVQVHPDDEAAARHGGEPKTEMWYVLRGTPGARFYAGLKPGATPEGLERALRDGKAADLLVSHPAVPGETAFIRGGCVHAVGEGCLLLEVQQNSDTTYRLYDWDRLGRDGKPRELHVEQALKVIRWDLGVERPRPGAVQRSGRNLAQELIACPYFRVSRLELAEPQDVANEGRSFHVTFTLAGRLRILGNDTAVEAGPGTSCLLPAALDRYNLAPVDDRLTALRITQGRA